MSQSGNSLTLTARNREEFTQAQDIRTAEDFDGFKITEFELILAGLVLV